MVMVIEDAHWADRSTRDLLAFLIRNQRALDGLLIVVIYRSDELHRSHPLRPLLAELDRIGWVTRMELGRLSRPDTGELVARLLGREPGEEVLETVYRRTEGNPLFVEALLSEGELGTGLPESLRDLLVAGVGGCRRTRRSWSGSRARPASGSAMPCWPRSPGWTTPGSPGRCGPRWPRTSC